MRDRDGQEAFARRRGIAGGMPPSDQIRRQIQLPLRKAARIAFRNTRARPGRSALVVSGIVLAIAFLTYILCSDSMWNHVVAAGDAGLVERLQADGRLSDLDDADARIQTWWLVGLALMVSFVSIFSAILLSVTERYREIGTMKCLGALDSLIVKLFLLESLFQGALGTALGVAIGLLLACGEGFLAAGGAIWPLIPFGRLARLAGVCLAVGTALTVAGAVYPTWRAARMRPVDAMRLEV